MRILHHHERRMVQLRRLPRHGPQALVLGLRGQLEVDGALRVGGILEGHHPGRVLLFAFQLGLDLLSLQRLIHRPQIRFLTEIRLGVDRQIGARQNLDHARIAQRGAPAAAR